MPRQNTNPANFPQAVLLQIEQLAHNITIARKRRGETQAQWARKLGVSQPTVARIERGDPGVAMASYVMCMWLIDPEVDLADLISPLHDHAALEREVSKVSKKRQAPRTSNPAKRVVPNAPTALGPDSRQFDETHPARTADEKLAVSVRSAVRRGSTGGANTLSELVRMSEPLANALAGVESSNKLWERAMLGEPMKDARKVLERAVGKQNATAEGLAALLKTEANKP